MDPHRYCVGQTVQFSERTRSMELGSTPVGNFRVVGLLPESQGRNQYRVESTSDSHQRVAVESEILVR